MKNISSNKTVEGFVKVRKEYQFLVKLINLMSYLITGNENGWINKNFTGQNIEVSKGVTGNKVRLTKPLRPFHPFFLNLRLMLY